MNIVVNEMITGIRRFWDLYVIIMEILIIVR